MTVRDTSLDESGSKLSKVATTSVLTGITMWFAGYLRYYLAQMGGSHSALDEHGRAAGCADLYRQEFFLIRRLLLLSLGLLRGD